MTRRGVRALVAEQDGTSGLRDPARATHGEVGRAQHGPANGAMASAI